MEWLGKMLIAPAALLFVAGTLIYALSRLGGGLLPGDIVIKRDNLTIVLPVVTMLVVSVVLTIFLNLVRR